MKAIKLAIEAIAAAETVPIRRSNPATNQLEIVTDALPAASPLRTAAMLENDPLIQAALNQRREALVTVVEHHLASNPTQCRATLLGQLRGTDPAAAAAAFLLFSDDEIAAMSARARLTGRPGKGVTTALSPKRSDAPESSAVPPAAAIADVPALPDPLATIARLFHSDDWDPRDYGQNEEPASISGKRAGPEFPLDVDHLAWLQHMHNQRSR